MRSSILAFGCVVSFAACTGSDATRVQLATNAETFTFCCDPGATAPAKIGEFQVQIYEGQLAFLDPATIMATFTSVITGANAPSGQLYTPINPVSLSIASGAPLELGSTTVEVLIDDCHFSRVNVRFLVEVIGRRVENRSLAVVGIERSFDVINLCPPAEPPPTPPERIVEKILGASISGFAAFGRSTPVGVPTFNANPTIPAQVPPEGYTETFEVGAVVVALDQQQLDDAFTGAAPTFPLGNGPEGTTIESLSPEPMSPGLYLLAWQSVVEDIPLMSMEKFLRYAFVADRDADSANNFRAQAPLEKDPFDDTDTWYMAEYDRFLGWRVTAVDAQIFPPQPFSTAARVVIRNQVQMVVIPLSELDDPVEILTRYSTLSHEGDQGLSGGPWSADATNPVGEPRITVPMAPSY